MICDRYDVVEVPFPFTDLPRSKRRKAIVISLREFNERNSASVLMMITSAMRSSWWLDVSLQHLRPAGLHKPCVARAKLFTLDNGLIARRCGQLHAEDATQVASALGVVVP